MIPQNRPAPGRRRIPGIQERSAARVSYYLGNDPSRWHSGIDTFGSVFPGNVFPGVGVTLEARGGNVEKVYTLEPNADPGSIEMRIEGARYLSAGRRKTEAPAFRRALLSTLDPLLETCARDGVGPPTPPCSVRDVVQTRL